MASSASVENHVKWFSMYAEDFIRPLLRFVMSLGISDGVDILERSRVVCASLIFLFVFDVLVPQLIHTWGIPHSFVTIARLQ